MKWLRLGLLGAALAGSIAAVPSCGGSAHSSGTDSNTHWLSECESDASCGSLKCVCGVCSQTCSSKDECSRFGGSATCAVPEGCASEGSPSACVDEASAGSGGSTSQGGSGASNVAGAPDGNGGESESSAGGGVPATGGAANDCAPGEQELVVYPYQVFNSRPDDCIDRSTPLHAGCAAPDDPALDVPAGFPDHTCVRRPRSAQFPSCCDLYLTTAPLPRADGWEECEGNDRALVEGARDCSEPPCQAGTHRAAPYYPERDCVGTGVFVGCAELINPDESLPQDWPSTRCIRRKSDGALFYASMPVRVTEWDECSATEAEMLADAAVCD